MNPNSAADIENLSKKLNYLANNTYFLSTSTRASLWNVCEDIELDEMLSNLSLMELESSEITKGTQERTPCKSPNLSADRRVRENHGKRWGLVEVMELDALLKHPDMSLESIAVKLQRSGKKR